MLTIFTIPKGMEGEGHISVIQRNAVDSWLSLDTPPRVILFGNEPGVAALASERGVLHEPVIATNKWGTPHIDAVFKRAEVSSTDPLFCFVNADVILLSDFVAALSEIDVWSGEHPFLMVGRRTNLAIRERLDLRNEEAIASLKEDASRRGEVAPSTFIDYFAFRRGTFIDIPPFAVGRPYYDNWLLWDAWHRGVKLVDATARVTAIHQNHDYSHAGSSREDVYTSEEAELNLALTGGWQHLLSIENVPLALTDSGVIRNPGPHRSARKEIWRRRLIDWSRPVRHRVSLRM